MTRTEPLLIRCLRVRRIPAPVKAAVRLGRFGDNQLSEPLNSFCKSKSVHSVTFASEGDEALVNRLGTEMKSWAE